jgi:hypothetical protein
VVGHLLQVRGARERHRQERVVRRRRPDWSGEHRHGGQDRGEK